MRKFLTLSLFWVLLTHQSEGGFRNGDQTHRSPKEKFGILPKGRQIYYPLSALPIRSGDSLLSPSLLKKIESSSPSEPIRVVIALKKRPPLDILNRDLEGKMKKERQRIVVERLKQFAEKGQEDVLAALREMGAKDVRSLWINNVILATLTKKMVENLIGIVEIGSMDWDEPQNVLLSETNEKFRISNIESRIRAEGKGALPNHEPRISNIEWNISKIRADEVWAKGFQGKGVVVGHLDTGVNYNHVDLKDHFWRNDIEFFGTSGVDDDGNGYVDDVYGYDFVNRDGDPIDDHGHGTHTAGTIAGDGTAGRQTGVAPDAQIMALKITDAAGLARESDVWEAIQYALDNGADVLSLSLGWLHSQSPNRKKWRETFENVLSIGVIAAVAAGNERIGGGQPAPDNIRTPGDVPPPWLHPDQTLIGGRSGVVTVGATNSSDDIASFSSFGPVTWKIWFPWTDYPYNPEMGLMDPDISAPGVCITSLGAFNNTGYAPCWNGTSMATPHVAGVMALLLSANPELNPSTLDYLIETSALDRGPQGKDNDYGAGRIDAFDALLADTLGNIPIVLALLPKPNPFRDVTKIDFEIPYPGHITLKVYDITGRLVITLLDEKKGLGRFSEPWNGRDERGVRVPNGIYFAWIEAEPEGGKEIERATQKMVFLK